MNKYVIFGRKISEKKNGSLSCIIPNEVMHDSDLKEGDTVEHFCIIPKEVLNASSMNEGDTVEQSFDKETRVYCVKKVSEGFKISEGRKFTIPKNIVDGNSEIRAGAQIQIWSKGEDGVFYYRPATL